METKKPDAKEGHDRNAKFEQERAVSLDYDKQRKGGTPSPPKAKSTSKEGKDDSKK